MSQHGRLEQVRTELETRNLIGPWLGDRVGPPTDNDLGQRLGQALPAIGPLFALFGRYLAGRTDRLPLHECRKLQRIRIAVEPTPMPRVGSIVSTHMGCPISEHFATFDEPNRTTFFHQWHPAELSDGTAVTVKLVRPEARALVDRELEFLPVLEELNLGTPDPSSLIEDFVVWVGRQLDLASEAAGLEQLETQVGNFDALEVPLQDRIPGGRNVLITYRPEGTPLDEIVTTYGDRRPRLAHHLCQAWLQQALLEGACPEGPLLENTHALSNERFAITGGLVTTLDQTWRKHLLDAVIATARHDPDRAGEALMAVSVETANADDRDHVRSTLRQAEAFRCDGWTEDYVGRHVADEFFVYLRLLSDTGYPLKSYAVSFIRGFSELESMARSMSPNSDVMASAIEDLRLVAAAVSVRTHLGSGALIRAAEELTPVIGEILEDPSRLTRRLTGGDDQPKTEAPQEKRASVSWQVFVGSLTVLAAGTIFGVTAVRAHPGQAWLEWLVTIGFVVLTAGIFRLVGKPADR